MLPSLLLDGWMDGWMGEWMAGLLSFLQDQNILT